jgi:thiol:disulfide interchange protein DsbD
MNFRRLLLLLAMAWLVVPLAPAQDFPGLKPSELTPSLVADTTALAAGQPFTIGVRLKMAPGWHTYWQFAGDSGAPLRVEWTLPPGFTAGPIQWPLPVAHKDDGDLVTNIYEGEVVLPVQITPPAQLPEGELTFKAALSWLVCELICIPGKGDVELKLSAGNPQPANAELFQHWRGQLPKTSGQPFTASWEFPTSKEVVVRLAGLAAEAKAELFPLPPAGAKPGPPQVSSVAGDGARTIKLTFEDSAPTSGWNAVVAVTPPGGAREGWQIAQAGGATPAPADSTAKATAPGSGETPPTHSGSLLPKLLLAFLGGLIMNVMPCVLPVIALKIFGFVGQAGQEPGRVFKLGLAFTAGVFAFFLLLAVAVIKLRGAFNWGYQFQNPFLLAGLIALVFVFALNLLGVFEIALSGGTATKLSELSRKEGYGGAFLHGLFTTLLGTSCTAPFLSTSLGFAVTQSTPVILLLFLAIAAGMSLPYFLLTAKPAWLRYVPKPGPWMERAKQLMGFVMLAVAVWLLGVLGDSRGTETAGAMCWFLFALGLASWLLGAGQGSKLAWLGALIVAVGAYFGVLHRPLSATVVRNASTANEIGGIPWQPFSEKAVAAAREAGRTVFIDFTADWCLNCKVYERAVLKNDAVIAKLAEKQVAAFKADWTNGDAEIGRVLKSFGRVGVPLYVLYRAGEEKPVVTDALTVGSFIADLDRIKTVAAASPR